MAAYGTTANNRAVASARSTERSLGKSAGAGTGPGASVLAGTQALTQLRPPATRPGLADGTVPGYGPDSPASPGQVVSSLGLGASILSGGVPGFLAGAASEDSTNRTLLGTSVDKMLGAKPGTPVATRNPIANNSQSRNATAGEDQRLADRAGAAATAALTGDTPLTGTDALYSDVALTDRRKPKSDLAGTAMLMKAA